MNMQDGVNSDEQPVGSDKPRNIYLMVGWWILVLGLLVGLWWHTFIRPSRQVEKWRSVHGPVIMERLRAVGSALTEYADAHDGAFPPTLEHVIGMGGVTEETIHYPPFEEIEMELACFWYLPGYVMDTHAAEIAVIMEPAIQAACFADGTVRYVSADEMQELLGHRVWRDVPASQ